jgi:hypothetical protein
VTGLRSRFVLTNPSDFLTVFRNGTPSRIDLDDVEMAQVWALAGLTALARRNGTVPLELALDGDGAVARFARAIGAQDVIDGIRPPIAGEEGRT